MDIIKEIKDRRSVRKYKSSPVTEEAILSLLEAARLAPSGNNTQPWRFMVIREEEQKRKICAADHKQSWMMSAPVFIVCLADLRCRMTDTDEMYQINDTSPEPELKRIIRDSAIAVSYILLQAQHLGLGTCWTGWYEQKEMREALGVPEYYHVSGIIPVGYPDEQPAMRPRHKLTDLIIQ